MAYTNTNLLPADGSTFDDGTTSWTGGDGVSVTASTEWRLSSPYATKVAVTTSETQNDAYSPYVGISEGETYVAYVPLGRSTAGSSVNLLCSLEWYDSGKNWLSRSGQFTSVLDGGQGFFSSSYGSPSGTAPTGAAFARILVRGSSLDVGYAYFLDNVYLCEAPRLSGNRLSFNAQSFEGGINDWTVTGANGSRLAGNFITGAGYYVLDVDDACTVSLNDAVAVNEGTEYVAYFIVSLDAAGDVSTSITWYDDSDDLISTDTATQNIATGGWYACAVGTAPSGAVGARLSFDIPNAAYIDQVQLSVAPNASGNLLDFNEYSFESVVPSMDNDNFGTPYLSDELSIYGHRSVMGTRQSAGAAQLGIGRDVPVDAGTTYLLSLVLFSDAREVASTGSLKSALSIKWLNGSGTEVKTDTDTWHTSPVTAGGVPSVSKKFTATAPAGTVSARVVLLLDTTNSDADDYGLDGVVFAESEPLYTVSVSNEMGVIESTLLYGPDPDKYPNIDTLSVYRVEPDGTQVPVRGFGSELANFPYPGVPFVFEDYEAPLGQKIWYRVIYSASNGQDPDTVLTTAMINTPVLDGDHMWFKSPGLPALNLKVIPEAPLSWARQARSATYNIVGRVNPIQVTSTRAGRAGTLTALVWDAEDSETLNKVLDYGTPILLQAMPGNGLDGNVFAHVGDVAEDPVSWNSTVPFRRWSFPLIQIDRPSGGMQGSALRTWDDAIGDLETWSAFYDAYENWAEVLTG